MHALPRSTPIPQQASSAPRRHRHGRHLHGSRRIRRRDGILAAGKSPSTPADPARAIFDAFEAAGVDPAAAETIVLGTTVATNALLERRGAEVIFVTTAGFRDVPIIQRVDKKDPYDLQWEKPRPFVERESCLEVDERVAADGTPARPLLATEVDRLGHEIARRLEVCDGPAPAVAISLLFAYANPEHEARLAEALRTRFRDYICPSRTRSRRPGGSTSARTRRSWTPT